MASTSALRTVARLGTLRGKGDGEVRRRGTVVGCDARTVTADEIRRQGIAEGRANDIIYTSLFTGVHGNYLRASIAASGLDPDNLPEADPSKMDFGSGGNQEAKAWKDIWGSGQGIGAVDAVVPAAKLIDRLAREYEAAKAAICS